MDRFERMVIGIVVGFILFCLVLTFVGADKKSDLWNKCHPEFQVTASEMWLASRIFMIVECDNE